MSTEQKLFIIGITGKARSGKDTVADMLASQLVAERYSFATPIKRMLEVLHLKDKEDDKAKHWYDCTYRHMVQTLGTEWGRELIHQDIWLKEAEYALGGEDAKGIVIISDVRFENEANWIRKNGILIFVCRPHQELIAESDHISEAGIDKIPTDWTLFNSQGLEQLKSQCNDLAVGILYNRDSLLRMPIEKEPEQIEYLGEYEEGD